MDGSRLVATILILITITVTVLALIPWFVDSMDATLRESGNYPILVVLLSIPNPIEEAILRIIAIALGIFGMVKVWM